MIACRACRKVGRLDMLPTYIAPAKAQVATFNTYDASGHAQQQSRNGQDGRRRGASSPARRPHGARTRRLDFSPRGGGRAPDIAAPIARWLAPASQPILLASTIAAVAARLSRAQEGT